jgi:pyruvate-ferredoxin/flavodoxin oxidoreductase
MTFGFVYLAAVAMGANMNQCIKAFQEAESFEGPSIIIAYAPCINHGINMKKTQAEEKLAVDTGYWILYRYNPLLATEGKNPLQLDSREPKLEYGDFLKNEVRYRTLTTVSEIAKELFARAADEAKKRYASLQEVGERVIQHARRSRKGSGGAFFSRPESSFYEKLSPAMIRKKTSFPEHQRKVACHGSRGSSFIS